jgi:hypothetical protein
MNSQRWTWPGMATGADAPREERWWRGPRVDGQRQSQSDWWRPTANRPHIETTAWTFSKRHSEDKSVRKGCLLAFLPVASVGKYPSTCSVGL